MARCSRRQAVGALLLAAAPALIRPPHAAAQTTARPLTRDAAARALRRIDLSLRPAAGSRSPRGMNRAQVLALLGEPGDVILPADGEPTSWEDRRVREGESGLWCYGTDGHLTLPTLGAVAFNAAGGVCRVFGGLGEPPRGIAEPRLRANLGSYLGQSCSGCSVVGAPRTNLFAAGASWRSGEDPRRWAARTVWRCDPR
jgi:hypothetical protein